MSSLREEGELDTLASDLDAIETWRGIKLTDRKNSIQARIESLAKDQDPDERSPRTTWAPRPVVSEDAALAEIRDMFDTLRPDS